MNYKDIFNRVFFKRAKQISLVMLVEYSIYCMLDSYLNGSFDFIGAIFCIIFLWAMSEVLLERDISFPYTSQRLKVRQDLFLRGLSFSFYTIGWVFSVLVI